MASAPVVFRKGGQRFLFDRSGKHFFQFGAQAQLGHGARLGDGDEVRLDEECVLLQRALPLVLVQVGGDTEESGKKDNKVCVR